MNEQLKKVLELIEFSNPEVCICVTDNIIEMPGPHIIYVNRKWKEVTGYSDEDVIGKTPRILQGPNSCKETLARLKKCLSNGEKFEGTTTNYTKSRKEINMTWIALESLDKNHFIALQKISEQDANKILDDLKAVGECISQKIKSLS